METFMGLRALLAEHLEELALVLVALFAAATILLLVLNVQVGRLLRRYRGLVRGAQGENLEDVLRECVERTRFVERDLEELRTFVEDIHVATRQHLQGTGVVRFNAFEGTGGDQSFAIALVDGAGNGVVLSSLYGRDESRVYAKPLEHGSSRYALSEEERLAVDQALGPRGRP